MVGYIMESKESDLSFWVCEAYVNSSVTLYGDRAIATYHVVAHWRLSKFFELFKIMGYVEGGS
jgi:hypothetical protein